MRVRHFVAGVAVLGGCTTHPPLVFDTATDLDGGATHAPAVAVDPPTELPKAAPSASSADGLAVLEAPADIAGARATVRTFFQAVLAGSADKIDTLVDDAAWALTGSSGRQKARAFWRARLTALDYRSLSGQLLYRESDLETYSAEDVSRLTGRRSLGLTPHDDEVLVRVPIVRPTSGSTRFFADEMLFRLRPRQNGFVIAEIWEDFRLP
jgi:hypothetical protein